MKLVGNVIGARVHFFKGVRLKSRLTGANAPLGITVESPGKNVLCFGLQHLNAALYKGIAANPQQGGGTYVPHWLESLAKKSGTLSKTVILLEYPPLTPETLELKDIESSIPEAMDAILNHSLKRLRPLFQEGGAARTSGWVLDGTDLRYRFECQDGALVRQQQNEYRQSLHRDLPDDLGTWVPNVQSIAAYYEYLTGLSDNQDAYNQFVGQVIVAGANTNPPAKRAIFSQAAAVCRTLYSTVPAEVRQAVIDFLGPKIQEVADTVTRDNKDLAMNESVAKGVIQYGIGEHLMNLAIIGYVLANDDAFSNVVVVAGDDHIKVLKAFLEDIHNRTSIITYDRLWSGQSAVVKEVGLCTDVPEPVGFT